jgi:hypothetical protein
MSTPSELTSGSMASNGEEPHVAVSATNGETLHLPAFSPDDAGLGYARVHMVRDAHGAAAVEGRGREA